MPDRLGDAPIEGKFRNAMNVLAEIIDTFFNAPPLPVQKREVGFVLLVFPFDDHEGRCNYISNAERADVVVMLKEQLARFEGQPEISGRG